MGKVYRYNILGYPGAISHSADFVVIPRVNKSEADIPFGAPVFLNSDGSGVVGISASSEAAKFVGFAVRSGAKTPGVYDPDADGSNSNAVYKPGEVMDILVRGSMTVNCTGSAPKPGMPAYINKTYGIVSALSSDSTLTVPGIQFLSERDSAGHAEILLLERHLQ